MGALKLPRLPALRAVGARATARILAFPKLRRGAAAEGCGHHSHALAGPFQATRRKVLAWLGSAGAAGATSGAAIVATTTEAAPVSDGGGGPPDHVAAFLAAWSRRCDLERECEEAKRDHKAKHARFRELCPDPPEMLRDDPTGYQATLAHWPFMSKGRWHGYFWDVESLRMALGEVCDWRNGKQVPFLPDHATARDRRNLRRRCRRRLPIAEAWEAECKRLHEETGAAAAELRYAELMEALYRDTRPMRELLMRTMQEATGNVLPGEQYGELAANAIRYVHIPIVRGARP